MFMNIKVKLNERYEDIGHISSGSILEDLMYRVDKGYIDCYQILDDKGKVIDTYGDMSTPPESEDTEDTHDELYDPEHAR